MNILVLTGDDSGSIITNFLYQDGNEVMESRLKYDYRELMKLLAICKIEFIVSYGYRYILPPEVIDRYKTVNLHISYLPWNKGADPNFWSWVDGTPKGVTIHYMDETINTGDIIAQEEMEFEGEWKDLTLYDTCAQLKEKVENLFMNSWDKIKQGNILEKSQKGLLGTFHLKQDIEQYKDCLTDGWNTKIGALLENIDKKNFKEIPKVSYNISNEVENVPEQYRNCKDCVHLYVCITKIAITNSLIDNFVEGSLDRIMETTANGCKHYISMMPYL